MARKTLPPITELWKRHELLYTEIFILALRQLTPNVCDVSNEDTISEALCPILTQVCYEEGIRRDCEIRTPDWEKAIQPVIPSELKGGIIRKRPDFTCKWINPLATTAEEYELPLHIECKRLGNPTSRSWVLNENYVLNGIMRFDSAEHEYGKRAYSGLMIGYIVSMTTNEIIAEVECYHQKHCSRSLNWVHQPMNNRILQVRQHITRSSVRPETFDIVHIWVDLKETFT